MSAPLKAGASTKMLIIFVDETDTWEDVLRSAGVALEQARATGRGRIYI